MDFPDGGYKDAIRRNEKCHVGETFSNTLN